MSSNKSKTFPKKFKDTLRTCNPNPTRVWGKEPPRIVTPREAKRGSEGVPVAKCEAAGDTRNAQETTMRCKSFNFDSPNLPETLPNPP